MGGWELGSRERGGEKERGRKGGRDRVISLGMIGLQKASDS